MNEIHEARCSKNTRCLFLFFLIFDTQYSSWLCDILNVSWHILICLYNSSNPRHMGKSFKSVIRALLKHEDSVHLSAKTWRIEYLQTQRVWQENKGFICTACVSSPTCADGHGVICAKVWFLVLFSGCSCSFRPDKICRDARIHQLYCSKTRNVF